MQSPQRKLKDVSRLLACYPPSNSDDPEQVLRNYMLAVDDYSAELVEEAVDNFIKGTAPGVNASFLPAPPVLGAECIRLLNILRRREDLQSRFQQLKPSSALPAPSIVHPPESQARVGEMVKATVDRLKAVDEEVDAEADKRRSEHWARVHKRFKPDMSDEGIRQRLIVTSMRYDVGDEPEARDD